MTASSGDRSTLRLLLGLDAQRVAAAFRSPTAGMLLGTIVPALVVATALIALGRVGVFATAGATGGLTLGLLVSGVVSFIAYGTLFGASDDLFLRRIGVSPAVHYRARAVRLLLVAAATVVAVALPYLARGGAALDALLIALAAAGITAGVAAVIFAGAARATVGGGSGLLSAGIRQWDPELARAAPLVYAPLPPFLLGAAAGAVVGGSGSAAPFIAAAAVLVGTGMAFGSAAVFAPAAGRFLPRVAEMAHVPLPEEGGVRFRAGRGLSALLPRKAAAVWVRDAAIAGRRFGWAARVSWPVAIVAFFSLARWGEAATTRVWVITAVGLALMVQAAAILAIGRLERSGPGWIDRSIGIRVHERALGRWAWGWGLSLWLLVPVALAWHWWSGMEGAWLWPILGALTAAFATTAGLVGSRR